MSEQKQYHFQVNLGGMLDVLSNHLYKSPDVFVRELLQNGVDAITLRKKRQPDWDEGRITISIEPEQKMTFFDNGAGLNEQEIHRFLAVIGQSSKTEMVDGKIPEDFIGRFGIGLLSCFMVSDSIVVHTKSVEEQTAHRWVGYPDGTYTLDTIEGDFPVGTSVILTAKPAMKDYFDPETIEKLVRYYGLSLPIPIYRTGNPEKLNKIPENFTGLSRSSLLSFGSWLFEEEFLDAIPIQTSHLSGVAYILPYQTNNEVKNDHRIYLKQMLLTESGDKLLPNWAFFLRCVLNTNSLRPTASREDFYIDEHLQLAREEFATAIRKYLIQLSQNSPQRMQALIRVHLHAIKSMAVWDAELFEIFSDYLLFETSEGTLTGAALKKESQGYWVDSVSKFKELRPLFMAQGKLLICGGYTYDLELLQRLTNQYNLNFQPLDQQSMSIVLEEVSPSEQKRAEDFLQIADAVLEEWDCKAHLASFFPSDLTVLYVIDDQVKFIRQVQMAQDMSTGVFSDVLSSFLSGVEQKSLANLYFNTNSPLVRRLCSLQNETLLQNTVKILYTQALLAGGHHLHGGELREMNGSLLELIEHILDLSE